MTTRRKAPVPTELETDLERLTALVRARRMQLARLEKCPNKDCPCRFVWREQVEKNLAGQMGKIRRDVRGKPLRQAKPKRVPARRSGR